MGRRDPSSGRCEQGRNPDTPDGMSKTAFVLGPEKALEIINRMPQYDAVFVCPDGKVLYSNGLAPPDKLSGEAKGAPAGSDASHPPK